MSRMVGVTGATGTIGRVVVGKLLDRGYQVKALLRENSVNIWGNRVKVVRGDVGDPEAVEKLMEGCDSVIHLAAQIDSSAPESQFVATNVNGVKNILKSIDNRMRVVVVSSVAVYRDTGKILGDENWEIKKPDVDDKYAKTKVLGLMAIRKSNKKVVTVMPGIVIDEKKLMTNKMNSDSKIINWLWNDLGGGIPGGLTAAIGDRNRMMNMVEINDVAEGIILAMEKGKPGAEYILGGQNIKAGDYLGKMSQKLGKRHLKMRIPNWAVKIAGMVFKMKVPKPENMNFSSQKAKKELGYNSKWRL